MATDDNEPIHMFILHGQPWTLTIHHPASSYDIPIAIDKHQTPHGPDDLYTGPDGHTTTLRLALIAEGHDWARDWGPPI
jgi:hypothetical protein